MSPSLRRIIHSLFLSMLADCWRVRIFWNGWLCVYLHRIYLYIVLQILVLLFIIFSSLMGRKKNVKTHVGVYPDNNRLSIFSNIFFILSNITLLIFPSSLFASIISLIDWLFWKFSLGIFSDMKLSNMWHHRQLHVYILYEYAYVYTYIHVYLCVWLCNSYILYLFCVQVCVYYVKRCFKVVIRAIKSSVNHFHFF